MTLSIKIGETIDINVQATSDGVAPLTITDIVITSSLLVGGILYPFTITKTSASTFNMHINAIVTSTFKVGSFGFDINFTYPDGTVLPSNTGVIEVTRMITSWN